MLTGKTAIITGCRRGIGKEAVKAFARNGANIYACCRAEDADFAAFAEKTANEHGIWIKTVYFDLADEPSVKSAMNRIISDRLPIDALVNNAGITHNALFQMTGMAQMRHVFEIDFFAAMLITQCIVKVMRKQKSGSIVNVSSVIALDGNMGQTAYGAAKSALNGATKSLARELAADGIRVNAVAPGVIDTDMTRTAIAPERLDRLKESLPSRKFGAPEDVANVLAFLASDLSAHVTGQIIRVDGGV